MFKYTFACDVKYQINANPGWNRFVNKYIGEINMIKKLNDQPISALGNHKCHCITISYEDLAWASPVF